MALPEGGRRCGQQWHEVRPGSEVGRSLACSPFVFSRQRQVRGVLHSGGRYASTRMRALLLAGVLRERW